MIALFVEIRFVIYDVFAEFVGQRRGEEGTVRSSPDCITAYDEDEAA